MRSQRRRVSIPPLRSPITRPAKRVVTAQCRCAIFRPSSDTLTSDARKPEPRFPQLQAQLVWSYLKPRQFRVAEEKLYRLLPKREHRDKNWRLCECITCSNVSPRPGEASGSIPGWSIDPSLEIRSLSVFLIGEVTVCVRMPKDLSRAGWITGHGDSLQPAASRSDIRTPALAAPSRCS